MSGNSTNPNGFTLSDLSYSPKNRAGTLGRYSLVAVLLGGAFLTGGLLVIEYLREPRYASPWALFGAAVLVVLFLILAYAAAQFRTFSVSDGVMTLPLPTRLKGGGRSRTILLRDVEEAVTWKGTRGEPGVLVRLRDGTEFALFEQDLPPDAGEFLRRLVAVFGASRSENTRKNRGSHDARTGDLDVGHRTIR